MVIFLTSSPTGDLDGSYVVDWNGMTRLGDGRWALPEEPAICGEAYLLRDGEMQKL